MAYAKPERGSGGILSALKALVFTLVAAVYWFFVTLFAVVLISVFVAAWYVFFGIAVFGDFLGLIGGGGPAIAQTRGTMIFVGAMALIVVLCCGLIVHMWNGWQRGILHRRRRWLGLA